MNEIIGSLDFSGINNGLLNISLVNNLETFKNLISVNISTNSNSFNKPGSGEKFLAQLKIISKILQENTNNAYEYLIIDKPERHLHPSLFKYVGEVLKEISNNNIKVIISTHSPVILKYFVDDTNEIFVFENGIATQLPDKDIFVNVTTSHNLYTDNNYKFSSYTLIENNKNEYFNIFILPIIYRSVFSKCVLLGEGHIEKEVFELLNDKYINDEKMMYIHSEVIFGKCFMPWVIECLHLCNLKVIGLFDTDSNTPKHINCNQLIETLSDSSISFSPEIENRLLLSHTDNSSKVKQNVINLRQNYVSSNGEIENLLEEIYNLIITLL
ncbi:aAA ATPase [Staphylococcus sp. CAG:324]|nr:aAA ATPase [Staphylococcus sp. CAG:324]